MPELRWGLTLPFAGVPLAEHEPLVRRAEAAGYDDLWTGETNGPTASRRSRWPPPGPSGCGSAPAW